MKRRDPRYGVVLIGLPPADITERVSQLHAKAIKARLAQGHLVSDALKAVSESRRPEEGRYDRGGGQGEGVADEQ